MSLLLQLALLMLLPPALLGVVQRVKAVMAGRRGAPLLQPYRDIARLFRKGAVLSTTGTWITALAPSGLFAATLLAFLLLPIGGERAPLAFAGDLVQFAYLLALARFLTVLLALDVGSSFEGMGASRDVWLGSMAEPALFLALGSLAVATGETSLSGLLGGPGGATLEGTGVTRLLVGLALFIVLLAETARIPVDDPATHLELTMIHEVMVLDASGPDLALCEWAHAIKFYGLTSLVVLVVLPASHGPFGRLLAQTGAALGAALVVGLVESVTARLALARVPQLLIGASVLAGVALATALGGR